MNSKPITAVTLFVSLTLLISSVFGSSVMWNQTYGSAQNEVAHWVVETSDNGYAIGGYTRDVNAGEYDRDFLLIKTDINGNMLWNHTYELLEYDIVGSFIETSDGGFAIAGESSNFWLIKTDEHGNVEWKQTYGSANDGGRPYSIVQTSDLGYALAGSRWTVGEGGTDVWLIKTDLNGNMLWNRTFASIGGDNANSLTITSDNGFALAGTAWSTNSSSYDFWLIKTDLNGNMQWNQTYDYNNGWWESADFVTETADGGYVIAGTAAFPPPLPVSNFWLIKTDEIGNIEWSRTIEENDNKKVNSIIMTSDGGFALAGVYFNNFWLVKLSSNGNQQWTQTYEDSESSEAFSIVETSDRGYAIAGEIFSLDAEDSDFWLVKTDNMGNIPEFPSTTILALVLSTVLGVLIFRKKLVKSSKK